MRSMYPEIPFNCAVIDGVTDNLIVYQLPTFQSRVAFARRESASLRVPGAFAF